MTDKFFAASEFADNDKVWKAKQVDCELRGICDELFESKLRTELPAIMTISFFYKVTVKSKNK